MKRISLLLSLMLVTGLLSAQTLTLEQARVLALANSRSIAKYNLSIQNSLLDEKNQQYSMLPNVSAGYTASMNYLGGQWQWLNPFETFGTGLSFSLSQIVYNGGKSFIQKTLSEIATESVRNEALTEYYNVLDSADNAYYAVLEAVATLEAAESTLQTATLSLAIAEVRQSSGMINQSDYLRAMADKESRENSRNQARRTLALNNTKLRNLTGLEQTVELEQIDFSSYEELIQFFAEISDEAADALYIDLLQAILRKNPSMARAAINSKRADINLDLTKRDYLPTVTATIIAGGVNYSPVQGFTNNARGGISLTGNIPIDFWVMNNRIEKSKNAQKSATLDYINAENSLEIELQSVLLNAFAQAGTVLSTRRSLEYAERNHEYVLTRYRLSQSSVSDLEEATTLLINNRNNLIRAQYGFLQSLSKLKAMGAMDSEAILMDILKGHLP